MNALSLRLERRLAWRLALLFTLSLPAVTARVYASDEIQYFAYLRSLWFDRDVSFDNEYRYFYEQGVGRSPGFHETFLERTTEAGRRINFGTIGAALLWSPFYATADAMARTRSFLAGAAPPDGFSGPYVAAIAVGSVFYGWASLFLAWRIAVHLVGRGGAATLAVAAGTPLLFYMYIAPPMAHATSAFAVALFVFTWLKVRGNWSPAGALCLGASGALMAMVREQDALLAIGPVADFLRHAWQVQRDPARRASRYRLLGAAGLGVAGFAVAFLPQAAAYVALNGHLGPSSLVTRKMTWWAPHGLQVLASPAHGFFAWTPLALVSCVGLVLFTRGTAAIPRPEARTLGLVTLVMVASQIYVAGSVESWTVAGAFGQRRFVALTVFLVLGLAAALRWAGERGWTRVALATVAVLVWWNLGLMAQFGAGLMDRQRLELGRNAYQTFVVVPLRLPELAYRYLFARSSFYESGESR